MKKSVFIILLISLFFISAYYKTDTYIFKENKLTNASFIKAIGDENVDETSIDMVQDFDGNFWITGRRANQSILLQINQNGDILDQKSMNITNGNDFTRYALTDSEGMIVVDGRDQPTAPTENFVMKFNPQTGATLWSKKYLVPAYTRLEQMSQKPGGGNYIVGGMVENPSQANNLFLMEIDKNTGNSVWQRSFDIGSTEVFLKTQTTADAIYACGTIRSGGVNKIRPVLVKFDHSGNLLWSRYYLTALSSSARLYTMDFVVEEDRIVSLIRGNLTSSDINDTRAFIAATTLEGDILSAKEINFLGNSGEIPNRGEVLTPIPSGGYLVSGVYFESTFSNNFLLKFDENLEILQSKSIGNLTVNRMPMIILGEELYFTTSSTNLDSGTNRDIIFGKLDLETLTSLDDCDWVEDLDFDEMILSNPFDSDFSLSETSINNPLTTFSIAPTTLDLSEENICECEDIPIELCDNGIDDDGDLLVDCDDPDLQDSCCCFVPPILDLGEDVFVCEGSIHLLNASDEFETYLWQDGSQNLNFVVENPGIYTVRVTDQCENIQRDTIEVFHLVSPETAENIIICDNEFAEIFGTNQNIPGDYSMTKAAQNGCDSTHTITLEVLPTLTSSEVLMICEGDSIEIFGNFETVAGDYESTETGFNGCDSVHTITLEILTPLSVDFQILPTCENKNNGFVQAIVSGGEMPYQYFWETSNSSADTLSDLAAGDYGFTVIDNFGCQLESNFTITTIADNLIDFEIQDVSCFGEIDGMLTILSQNSNLEYSLDGQSFSNQNAFENLSPNNYILFIKTNNGCEQTVEFSINEPAQLFVQLPNDTTICLGDSIKISALSNSINLIYEWQPTDWLSCIDCQEPTARPFENITYQVLVTNENDCTASDEIQIAVNPKLGVYLPNVFSPNNDGINELFYIFADQSVDQVLKFSIFDRWGELIFEKENFQPNDPTYGWDGTFKGKKMQAATFVWFAEILFLNGEREVFEGDVILVN